MKRYYYLSFLLLIASTSWSNLPSYCISLVPSEANTFTVEPIPVSWKLLANIDFELVYNKKLGMEAYAPIYPETIKQLSGKLVRIKGYVIPYDESQEAVALSANNYASCFFCGKASAASILTLRFAKPGKRYKVDAYRTFEGRLRLNYADPDEFYYVLDQAKEL